MNRSLAFFSTLLVLPVTISALAIPTVAQASAKVTKENFVQPTNSSLQHGLFLSQSNSTQAQTHFQQASEYFKQRKYDLALAEFNKVIELEPTNELAYLGRATIYLGQKEWNSALDNFNQAIKFDPKLALAYFGRGVVRLQVEGRDSGVADLKVAAQLFQEQKDTEGYQQVTSILKELGE